ncbi:DUF6773 family protein [Sutcliffiella rhizosphaerae]|uniref:Uncharacterized protein n=1 Tax=Sutcliffiella rhizosphaerae TaxID=2880967 RepID=A0ABM8YJE5_9BACI|nr:DUF6773 family protein [Sutcliffiella rhizosphaerae]CAG9620012.1 hypothetical protein BACCIP111883_00780 [Sutcliffiella rhizosphaerae]
MNIFGNATKVEDERLVGMQNKIYKELYYLVLFICLASIGIKFYLNGFSSSVVTTELTILLLQGIYYTLRASQSGVLSAEVEMHDRENKVPYKYKFVLISIAFAVLLALVFGFNSANNFADTTAEAYWFFFLVFSVSLLIYIPVLVIIFGGSFFAALKRSDKAAIAELQDDENDKELRE